MTLKVISAELILFDGQVSLVTQGRHGFQAR